ncbi:DUF768 domain-containing protein [Mesorhizobium caraganae]|uniref:DUF768 domain-containing protein n=1 Tax=Mesorhizobium caraganae TaxID=483206 RepID=UPI00289B6F62|nr:hypothetical protein [Mesorhizobium caraganae]
MIEHTRHRFFVQMDWPNVPATAGADVISIAELTQKLFEDAKAIGISSNEIEEATGSVYEAIRNAILHRDAVVAD